MEKEIKQLYYLDRETDTRKLAEEIIQDQKNIMIDFLDHHKNTLQEREAGEFFPVESILKLKDKGIDKMIVFYKYAVIQYYVRQEYDIWDEKIPPEWLKRGDSEMKKKVGFILYDVDGNPTGENNSVTKFKQLKQMNAFLKDVENVCFKDQGYKFPDSKHFKQLRKDKGFDAAKTQIFHELHEWYKNQFAHE